MNNVQERNFGYKVRHALNDQLDNLPASTTDRLASARQAALARKKKDAPLHVLVGQRALAGNTGGTFSNQHPWYARLGFLLPIVILVAWLFSLVFEKPFIPKRKALASPVLAVVAGPQDVEESHMHEPIKLAVGELV